MGKTFFIKGFSKVGEIREDDTLGTLPDPSWVEIAPISAPLDSLNSSQSLVEDLNSAKLDLILSKLIETGLIKPEEVPTQDSLPVL